MQECNLVDLNFTLQYKLEKRRPGLPAKVPEPRKDTLELRLDTFRLRSYKDPLIKSNEIYKKSSLGSFWQAPGS